MPHRLSRSSPRRIACSFWLALIFNGSLRCRLARRHQSSSASSVTGGRKPATEKGIGCADRCFGAFGDPNRNGGNAFVG